MDKVFIEMPEEIGSNYAGYSNLTAMAFKARDLAYGLLEIDMKAVKWFDANMSAVFGAILFEIAERLNDVRLINIHERVGRVLSKNTFLCNFGGLKKDDEYQTTIPFQQFAKEDRKFFYGYIDESLTRLELSEANKLTIPEILKTDFKECLFEIFNNSLEHSETQLGIFSCGQYFLRYQKLEFTLSDLGIGIHKKVQQVQPNLTPQEAIVWAVSRNQKTGRRNTTKTGKRPGGLGLKRVLSFIQENKGAIQIISDCGYYEMENGQVNISTLQHPFNGTIVNMRINTASLNNKEEQNG
jgi:hypothetical protein